MIVFIKNILQQNCIFINNKEKINFTLVKNLVNKNLLFYYKSMIFNMISMEKDWLRAALMDLYKFGMLESQKTQKNKLNFQRIKNFKQIYN